MKKSLIALAALAAFGTASAQSTVTISGKLAFGLQAADKDKRAAGLASTDGDVRFTAVEDLGGGLKITLSSEMLLRGRDTVGSQVEIPAILTNGVASSSSASRTSSVNYVQARDASLALSGGFGTVTIGAVESANGIMGLGRGGAPISLAVDFDSSSSGLLAAASNVHLLQYTSPEIIQGLRVSVAQTDGINNFYADGLDSAGAISAGTAISAANDYQGATQSQVIGLTYSVGALSVAGDMTDFTGTTKNRNRISASYDLGMVKIGAGAQTQSGVKNQTVMGLSAPLGPLTVGLAYAKNDSKKGVAYGARYDFSKTASLGLSVGDYTGTTFDGSQWRVRLLKSF